MFIEISNKVKKLTAFTLVELILVIAIISILASIVVLTINPQKLFQMARDSTRSTDIDTFKNAIQRYIADGAGIKATRTLNDFDGYAALYAAGTISSSARCDNGSSGAISVSAPFSISLSGTNSLNFQPLITSGYLTSLMKDPLNGATYLACIDNVNGKQIVIYPSTNETGNVKAASLNSYDPGIIAWDSFDRADNSTSLGTADTGQTWVTPNSTWGISNNKAMVFTAATTFSASNKSVAYLATIYSDCIISLTVSSFQSGILNGISYRVLDGNNYLIFGNGNPGYYAASAFIGGGASSSGSWNTIPPTDGDNLKIKIKGNSVTYYVNGVQLVQFTQNTNLSSTGHGLSINYANKGLIDNFLITKL